MRGCKSTSGIDLMHKVIAPHRRARCVGHADRAGIVYTDIDPPEGLDSLRNRGLNLLFIPDVTPDSQCGAASGLHVGRRTLDSARQFGMRFNCLGGDDDVSPILRGPQTDASDARVAPVMKSVLPLRSHTCRSPRVRYREIAAGDIRASSVEAKDGFRYFLQPASSARR